VKPKENKMTEHIDISLDEEFNKIDSLKWLPFIGEQYFDQKNKTLIIGESHYVPVDEAPEFYNNETWTRQFILKEGLQVKPWNQGESKNNLVREIEKTLEGQLNNEFWQKIAYFNLIQRLLPSIKGQDRPTYEDIKNGLNTFKQIVSLFEPDRIIFCGTEAAKHFQNLLNDDEFQVEKFRFPESKINGAYPKSFELLFSGKKRICYFIKHPSMFYSSEQWREFISEK
jgi:hypothetical protein